MREKHTVKILMVAVPLIIAFFSVFVVSGIASSAEFHASSIAALDEKQTTVLELTAASTAASAAVTLLPGDSVLLPPRQTIYLQPLAPTRLLLTTL